MEEMKEAYLRCKYYSGDGILFSNECGIKFKPYNKGEKDWCIIDKTELAKKIDEENGLVRVVACSSAMEGRMLVAITDAADHRISVFSVPETEIVEMIKMDNKETQIKRKKFMPETIETKTEEGYWEHIEKIAREVDSWPKWKRNLSGLGSNYCSELQPLRGEYDHDLY